MYFKSTNFKNNNKLDSTGFINLVKKEYKNIKHIKIFQIDGSPFEI